MYNFNTGGTQENDPIFDEKLNNAFRTKQHKIEIRREKEMNELRRKERKDKLGKDKDSDDSDSKDRKKLKERRKSVAVIENSRELKKAAQNISFIEEERKLHEAYQLILSEHLRRIEKMKARANCERRVSVTVPTDQMSSLKLP